MVEAVSVMPYPSRMAIPKLLSKRSSRSGGMDAPPEIPTRKDRRSNLPASGRCRRSAYMVCTPSKMVTRSRWMTSKMRSGSKRGWSDMVAANRRQQLTWLSRPNTWNSGRQMRTTSSGRIPKIRAGV
jgi:hypothetical protein